MQEGGAAQATKQLQSFQSLVSAELQKLQAGFQSKDFAFPSLPVIRDLKAFQVCSCSHPCPAPSS